MAANSGFLRGILVVCVLFGLGQLLVYRYGVNQGFGQVSDFRRTGKRADGTSFDSREFSPDFQLLGQEINEASNFAGVQPEIGQPMNASSDLPIVDIYAERFILPLTGGTQPHRFLSNSSIGKQLQDRLEDVVPTNGPKYDGSWSSSFVSPKYHKHFNVNCSAIVHNSRPAIEYANNVMGKTLQGELPIPSDEAVRNWTENCEVFRSERSYPIRPNSVEEAHYPIAFIIVTHKESAQIERLLRAIYQPQNVYCIHPDRKSPPAYQAAIRGLAECFENVFIASKIEDVQYAGYTRLQADINCMADLRQHPIQWQYVLNLCGQDFPLKTNLEMVRQLKVYGGKNDINGILPPPYIRGRTASHFTTINGKLQATRIRKSPPPYNLTVYFGNAYYAANRAFVDYVITNPVAIALLGWSEDTFSPDEHYWVTLNRAPGVPGGYHNATWDANVRFMKWGDIPKHPPCKGKYVRALCVFGIGYLHYLTTMPHLFANKFYYSFDPVILQCLEDILDFRTAYPKTIGDFTPNFPATKLEWLLN